MAYRQSTTTTVIIVISGQWSTALDRSTVWNSLLGVTAYHGERTFMYQLLTYLLTYLLIATNFSFHSNWCLVLAKVWAMFLQVSVGKSLEIVEVVILQTRCPSQ